MATIREFVTRWGFEVNDTQLRQLDKGVLKVRKNLQKTADTANRVGQRLSLFVTAPILALGAASVKAASDTEETFSKFATVFQDVADESEMVANAFAKNFGLAGDKSKQLLSDTGDLLTGFGFTGKSALDLAKATNELAVDLASFTNFSGGAEGASKALTKALLGERESVKSLGIAILEEDVKAKVKALTAAGRFTDETERQKKAIATLEIAVGQSKNAIGDFARTSKSFANQSRILRARFRDLTVMIGKLFLPAAKNVVSFLIRIADRFSEISPKAQRFILIFAGIAAAIGPLLITFALVTKSLLFMQLAFNLVGVSAAKSFAIIFAKVILVGALITGLVLLIEDFVSFLNGEDSLFGALLNEFNLLFDVFSTKFPILASIISKSLFIILTPLRAVIGAAKGIGTIIGALAGGVGAGQAFKEGGAELLNTVTGAAPVFPQSSGGKGATTQTQQNNITINTPVGTTPEQVGPFVQEALSLELEKQRRQTGRQVQGAIEN